MPFVVTSPSFKMTNFSIRPCSNDCHDCGCCHSCCWGWEIGIRDCVARSAPQFVSFFEQLLENPCDGNSWFLSCNHLFLMMVIFLYVPHGKYDLQSHLIHISDFFFCPTVFRLGCSVPLVIEPASFSRTSSLFLFWWVSLYLHSCL